ncbi:MAG: DUF6600 domain-containing protein [Terriglobia bacterium]
MKGRFIGVSLVLVAGLLCLQALAAAQGKGYTHVRVVRLSFVDGAVTVRRPGSTEWTKGQVNTPIEEGFSVATDKDSFAEVEFENGSTARLGQLSQLDFSELALSPDGSKINRLTFDHGYGTFSFAPEKHEHDVYSVKAGAATLVPDGKAEFRTDFKDGGLQVEVFSGSVNATMPGQQVARITKDKTLSSPTEVAYNVTKGIEKDNWDKWVHARDEQTELAYNDSPVGLQAPVDGWADLNEYGAWGFFPGVGYAWSPFVSAGWAPFSAGAWSYYPSFGYTWISDEPWGWLPFHYGGWAFSSSYGYLWQPGAFNTFYPGLVNWYQGPGYVGWAPAGLRGASACNPGTAGCVTAVKPGTLQGGGSVNSGTRVPVNPRLMTRITRPVLPLGATRAAGAIRIAAPTSFAARGPMPSAIRAVSPLGVNAHPAPRIVLMGQNPAQAARVEGLANAHRSFMSRAFGNDGATRPATVRLGNTIGGRYNIRQIGQIGQIGSMRANGAMANREGVGFPRSEPVFLHGRSNAGYSGARYQMTQGGAIRMQSRGINANAPSPAGGFHGSNGPAMSAPSVRSSAPRAAASSGRTVSSAGPHR